MTRQSPLSTASFYRRPGLLATAMAVSLLLTSGASPAFAEGDGGDVVARVFAVEAPAEVCVVLQLGDLQGGELDFGPVTFGQSATAQPYSVASCSSGDQELYGSGTDAAGSTAAWSLGAREPVEPDDFAVDAALDGGPAAWLSTSSRQLATMASQQTMTVAHTLFAPPPGSSGAGEEFTFMVSWMAVLAESAAFPPNNDEIGSPWSMRTAGTFDTLFTTDLATVESGEPISPPPCDPAADLTSTVWFTFDPAQDGEVIFHVTDPTFDADVVIYENDVADATAVACDTTATTSKSVAFQARRGNVYLIQVGGRRGLPFPTGDFKVLLDVSGYDYPCNDGLDNEMDGLIDGADPDCANDPDAT